MTKLLLAVGTLLLALPFQVGVANAEPPAGPAPGHGKPAALGAGKAGPGKAEHGQPGPGAASGKPEDSADKPRDRSDRNPETGSSEAAESDMKGLLRELKSGKLKKGEISERLAKLQETRDGRALKHRHELKQRFGNALAMPATREELEHHARRMARLDRAMLVCESEAVKDKEKLKERIQKLIDKENARHQQAMDRLKSQPSTPAASAVPGTPSAAPAKEGSEK